jgi:hypothetical protein
VHTRYPFQGALYGLPPDVLKDCIIGAIEARFGPLKAQALAAPATPVAQRSVGATRAESVRAGSSTSACKARDAGGLLRRWRSLRRKDPGTTGPARQSAAGANDAPRNFEEFIYKVWGAGIAKHFAIPYNRKLWAVPLTEMETSWLGGRVPLPDLEEMIEGRAVALAEADGPERALRLSAARRLPGADGRLPAAAARKPAAEHRVVGGIARTRTRVTLERRHHDALRAAGQHHAAAVLMRDDGRGGAADVRAAAAACATSRCAA